METYAHRNEESEIPDLVPRRPRWVGGQGVRISKSALGRLCGKLIERMKRPPNDNRQGNRSGICHGVKWEWTGAASTRQAAARSTPWDWALDQGRCLRTTSPKSLT